MNPSPEPGTLPAARRRWRPLHFMRVRLRLMICAAVFAAIAVLLALGGMRATSALLLGFDLAALIYLVAMARMFTRSDQEYLMRQARLQDTGRRGTLAVAVLVSLVVLVALSTELHAGKSGGVPVVALAAASVVLSWLFMNTMFALHYAHSF